MTKSSSVDKRNYLTGLMIEAENGPVKAELQFLRDHYVDCNLNYNGVAAKAAFLAAEKARRRKSDLYDIGLHRAILSHLNFVIKQQKERNDER
jgi:hypothetical protein